MTIGRDVLLDTRLMIAKLEELFPASSQHPGLSSPQTKGLAQLLARLSMDVSMFRAAVAMIPSDFPLLKDPKFQRDRAGFFGPNWKLDDSARPEAVTTMRHCFDLLESLLYDGRKWVGGADMSLGDLEGELRVTPEQSIVGRLMQSDHRGMGC